MLKNTLRLFLESVMARKECIETEAETEIRMEEKSTFTTLFNDNHIQPQYALRVIFPPLHYRQ